MNKYINYRPEIDGLRAIAVLSVIFYHSSLEIFEQKFLPGGFIGVDIFFVISGYLISKIIFNEIKETNNFSFINFYKRRVRRIIPALFFVIIVTFPFIYLKTMPNFFVDYAKSIISIVFFISNLFFWSTTIGYDQLQNVQFQPFLHAWTLSLEEQFYFIFPLLFILVFKFFRKYLLLLIFIAFFVSLFLSDYMSYTHASINFYSLPTRAWEFLAGTLLVLLEKRQVKITTIFLNTIFVIFGFILLILSFLFLDDRMYLPSLVTLAPVLGTCLIIFFSNNRIFFIKILSSKLFRGIGLISYSLYLWHYPIFIIFPNINLFVQLIIIFNLSIFSYFFIEKKFRTNTVSLFYSIKSIMIFGLLILASALITLSAEKNTNYNFYPTIVKSSLIEKGVIEVRDDQLLKSKENSQEKNLFVVGDSHMFVLNRALKKTKLAQNYNLISQTLSGGCFYVHGFNKINYFTRKKSIACSEEHQEKRKNNFLKKEESIVIIGGRIPLYLNGDNVQINRFYDKKSDLLPQDFFINNDGISFKDGVKNSIEDLLNKGTKIILIYPVPVLNFNPPKKIFDSYIFDKKNFKKNLQEKPFTISYNSFLVLAAYVSIAFIYLVVVPLILYYWMNNRWNLMGKFERLGIYGLVFLFFPGLILFAPFLNLRLNGQRES